MCGIVGYIGKREAYPVLIKGLHRLEYRGYDSAGVALVNAAGRMNIYKARGKVSDLETTAKDKDCSSTIGIAHTRWATHGEPSLRNAHPHVSESGDLAIVHNGIIENFAVLRDQLKARGYHFQSDTDTEVLVQLIQYVIDRQHVPLPEAVAKALQKCVGAYAIAVIDRKEPQRMVAARKGSPLVVGVGKDNQEFFIASDATPIVEYTKNVVYLDDNQVAVAEPGKELRVYNLDASPAEVEVKQVELDIDMLSKGGFPHFMLKEIFDQPDCLRNCMSGRLLPWNNVVSLSCMNNHRTRLLRAKRYIIVACGTSWHAGLIGKELIEKYCRIPVEVDYASEFRYRDPVISPDDVVIAISQSGETADTLAAIRLAKAKGAYIFGIVNAVGSSIARQTDTGIYIHVGPEIGVASTKAFTGQVACLVMFTLALGRELGTMSMDEYTDMTREMENIPEKIDQILSQNEKIKELAGHYASASNFLYLGRGWNYPVALEGALKLKEISYIHAEGYPAAEMKHGPIALIDENMPCMFVATHLKHAPNHNDDGSGKIISNMQEVRARHGHIIAVVTKGDEEVARNADEVIEIPKTYPALAPLLSVIPLQLFAYHTAVLKGLNVDMPRNLAKSVTVE